LRIIIYEHISGGGCVGQPIGPSVLSEGFGMLRTIVSDFRKAEHEVTVLIDERLARLNPPLIANCIIPVSYPREPQRIIRKAAKTNDAIYVIAPETGQALQSMVRLAEQTGKISLNCKSSTIKKVGDKTLLYPTLEKNRLPTPKTIMLKINEDLAEFKRAIKHKLSYPALFKPADGVSCAGLSIVNEDAQIEKAVAKIRKESSEKLFVAQEFVEGEAASVSVLSAKGKASSFSLNKQNINITSAKEVSSYEGGIVPLNHPLKNEAFAVAEKTVESFPGFVGYVGVDLVLTENEIFVVDVNPRLTTSYIGLCKVTDFNIAQAMVVCVSKKELPAKPESHGYAYFSKIETIKPTISAYHKAAQIDEVVSPPFPLDGDDTTCSLAVGHGDSLKQARMQFEEAKKRLLNIINGDK
jgi:predicted ATP-grasp superfamily ATP-dependent carboligase